MRPAHPAAHGIADLVSEFGLRPVPDPSSTPPPGGGPDAVAGLADVVLTGVTHASAEAEPGDLFVALPGLQLHGATYARSAVDAGAVAVLTDAAGRSSSRPARACRCSSRTTPARSSATVAAWVHGHPARELTTVGVTGTNGKTTTTYFVDAALRTAARARPPSSGTVELRIGERAIESPRTTVEAPGAARAAAARPRARAPARSPWRSPPTRSRWTGCTG